MKKISEEFKPLEIQGMLLPFNPLSKKPVFLEINGQFFLPIFSTKDKFNEAAKWAGFTFAACTSIEKTDDFKKAVFDHRQRFPFHVIADPYITKEGNTRFQLIPLEEDKEKLNG